MPTLLETIGEYEEDLLGIIASQWGIEIEEIPIKKLSRHIVERITHDAIRDLLESLPEADTATLSELSANKGRIPWPQFVRKYGELREMGPARRQREQPDAQPTSITESLYYKGLIGKAFFDARGGPREFAYIPDEILAFFEQGKKGTIFERCRSMPNDKIQKKWIANDFIVDHASTVLAALRTGISLDPIKFNRPEIPTDMLIALLQEANLVSLENEIRAGQVKTFLETRRGTALTSLMTAWRTSERINELQFIENIEFEKVPTNDPRIVRLLILDLLRIMPEAEWYGIDEFIGGMHETHPDFLRNAGEYDAWFVRDKESGDYLSGFEHWQAIEGQYLRKMIQGPFHWFGLLDLGKKSGGEMAFRRSQWSDALLNETPLDYPALETHQFLLEKNGQILIDRYFPRDIRYQIARFCDWGNQKGNRYEYRVTPESLERMREQGLTIGQLISLLQKYVRKPLPDHIFTALKRWEKNSLEVEITRQILIRVKSAKILDSLLVSPAKVYIRERLNPDCAVVDIKGVPFIQAALLELGYFAEIGDLDS
jgi:hypothetical protein